MHMTSFIQIHLVSVPTQYGRFCLNHPVSGGTYSVFLEGWRDRTVGITQMVLGEVAISEKLPTCCLSHALYYNSVMAVPRSVTVLPQGRPLFNPRPVRVAFLLSWSRWIESTSTHHVSFRRIVLPSVPRSLEWPFPSRFPINFCMYFSSAMRLLVL
jgi:hypothetical protein